MEEANVVVAECQDVAGKAAIDFLGASVVLEILVISKNVDDKFGSEQEVAPMFEGTDDSEELPVPDRVIPFSFGEGRGIIAHGVTQAVGVTLVEDGARGKLRGIDFQFERFVMVGLSEYGVGGGKVNETVQGRGAFRSPDEGCAFLKEIQKGASDFRKTRDEGAMIAEDSQRRPHFFNGLQHPRPFCDARDFAGIDAEGVAIEQES